MLAYEAFYTSDRADMTELDQIKKLKSDVLKYKQENRDLDGNYDKNQYRTHPNASLKLKVGYWIWLVFYLI